MTDMASAATYRDYLQLDTVLNAQRPLSDLHDEMLFVVVHQTKELWLKQIIHELVLSRDLIRDDALLQAHKSLSRISQIQLVMTLSWDVLATITPTHRSSLLQVLGSSSGFQSRQFRQLGIMLGLRDGSPTHFDEELAANDAVREALDGPSLWDEANRALARAGFDLPLQVLERDWSEPYRPNEAVEEAWLGIYRDSARWWPLYQLAEKLVDIDDSLGAWRHKHVSTVERIIGADGMASVSDQQSTMSRRAFPELWSLRNKI